MSLNEFRERRIITYQEHRKGGFEMRTDDHDDDGMMLEFRTKVIAAFLNIFRNNDSSLANNGQMDHASPRQYCLKLSDVN